MVNKDIRLAISFIDHPKVIKLERLLTFEGVKSLLRLWCFAAQNKPNGCLTGMDAEDVEIAARWPGEPGIFLSAVTDKKCHFIDIVDGVFCLHDWEEHQGYVVHAKERSDKAKLAANARWQNRNATSNATSMRQAMLNKAASNAPDPDPDPDPDPTSKPKTESKALGRFSPPSPQDVAVYCLDRGNSVDPQHWWDHYQSNGWKVGKTAMKDWRAAVRTWERKNGEYDRRPSSADEIRREKTKMAALEFVGRKGAINDG